jgi:Cdc6-like AAA superfamily ATPase
MSIKTKGVKKHKESILALSAYEAYKTTRSIEGAYNLYMQENVDALTTIKKFVQWGSENSWQSRINEFDAEEDLRITQATRRTALGNSLTAEEMYEELITTCMEEFKLHRSEMSHSDIVKYLKVADNIASRWGNGDTPQVVVNVGDVNTCVDVPDDVLKEVGRKMAAEDDK